MDDETKDKLKSTRRKAIPQISAMEEFYLQARKFKIENGYLLRMLEDGKNVILSDDFKNKLYMEADPSGELFSGTANSADGEIAKT